MNRLLVTGGRGYDQRYVIAKEIGLFAQGLLGFGMESIKDTVGVLIHGGASGADELAVDVIRHYPLWTEARYPALWDQYGRSAGPIRNQQMIDEGKPDYALVFPGGPGTRDMMTRLFLAGVPFKYVGR